MNKAACLLICLATQCAQAAHQPNPTFTGFYLTGAVGASSADFDVSPNLAIPETGTSFPGDYSMYGTSAMGLLGVGYLHQFHNRFILGAEATAGYMKAEAEYKTYFNEFVFSVPVNATVTSTVKAQLTNDFALLAKPGYLCGKKTMFYGILGPRWGNFETSSRATFAVDQPVDPLQASGSDEESGYQIGLTAGVGIQQMLIDRLHLSLEYVYTTYGEIDSPEVSATVTAGGAPSPDHFIDSPEINASTNTIMLALSYQW